MMSFDFNSFIFYVYMYLNYMFLFMFTCISSVFVKIMNM